MTRPPMYPHEEEGPRESPAERAQEQRFSRYNVLAFYDDMTRAREAISALERKGIDAANVSLLGPGAKEAADETDVHDRDMKETTDVGKRAVTGAAVGSVAGGVLGFVAGAAAFTIPGVGPVIGTGIWASTIGGAVAGGGVGGVVGGVSAIDVTEATELTYDSVRSGHVAVGVHADERATVDKGADVLRSLDPLSIHWFDDAGSRIGGPGG